MKHKFYYGSKPNINYFTTEDFNHNGYECRMLLQTKRGEPVIISRHKELDIWKVQNGFSAVFFGTKAEVMAYCNGRFLDADGKVV